MVYDGTCMVYDGTWFVYDRKWMVYDGTWFVYDGKWMPAGTVGSDALGTRQLVLWSWINGRSSLGCEHAGTLSMSALAQIRTQDFSFQDGKWKVYDGKLVVYDGKWFVYDGKLFVYDGKWMVYDGNLMVDGCFMIGNG